MRVQLNLLVDTHIVIWSLIEPEKISTNFLRDIVEPKNQVWVSSISLWEMVTKMKIGKLKLEEGFYDQVLEQGFQILPFEANHALRVFDLPLHHKDPFDRGLLAQASCEKFKLFTADTTLAIYDKSVAVILMD
jgi:PIN domain nuclease of toxin-antitoxin system